MMLDMDIKYNLHMSPISVSHIQLADLSRPFGLIHIVSSQDEDWHSQCSPEAFSGYWLPRSLRLGRLNGAAKRTELQSVKLSNFPSIAKKNLRKNYMPATSTVEVSIAAGANLSHWDGKRLIFGSNDTGSGENLPCPLQSPPTPTPPTKTTPSRPGQRPPCQLPSLLPELLLISLNHHCQPPRAQNWFFKGLNIHTIRNWEKFL